MELNPALSRERADVRRSQRVGEAGFTLAEVLVSLTLLALISASLAAAMGISFKILAPSAAQATLRGNHDTLAFEQQIGADVARANCLAAPGQTTIPSGGCAVFAAKCAQTTYSLCLGWFQPGSTKCHEVAYEASTAGPWVERRDLFTGSTGRISTGNIKITATWTPTPTSTNSYSWTKAVQVTVKQLDSGKGTPVQTSFNLVPYATDPLSAAEPAGWSPC